MKLTTKIILILTALALLFIITWCGKTCQMENRIEIPSPVVINTPTINPIPTAIDPRVLVDIQDRITDTEQDIEATINNDDPQQSSLAGAEEEMIRRGLK